MKEESPFTHLCSQLKLSEHDMHVVAFSMQMGDFNASQMGRLHFKGADSESG